MPNTGNYEVQGGDTWVVTGQLLFGGETIASSAVYGGAGSSAAPVSTSDADKNFLGFYWESQAVSGDARGIYNRLYLAGAGVSGESLRTFTTVDGVAAATGHGAHISLSFGDGTGSLSGLGVAGRCTLHIPDAAAWTSGTLAAVQAEIFSDGTASDPDGLTELSFLRIVNGGHADGIADVDDKAFLFVFSGGTIGAGNLVQTETDETKFSHKIRCKAPDGTTLYLMACAT